MSRKYGLGVFPLINGLVMTLIMIITLYPFLYIAATSLSDAAAIAANRVTVWPIGLNLKSYEMVLSQPLFWSGYRNTILYATSGTILSLIMTVLAAYPLSKKHLFGGNLIMKGIVFTMFFGGGMIPTYLVVRSLGLIDTIWAIILPNVISTFNLILMRTYFAGIPVSLEEAARVDGLRPAGILIRIVLPLSKPILATMTLFYAVDKWNAWFKPLLYLNKPEMMPVTLFLRNVVFSSQIAMKEGGNVQTGDMTQIYMTIKSTTILLVVLPLLCVYPFVQRYFVQGVMLGSIKE